MAEDRSAPSRPAGESRRFFTSDQLHVVNDAVALAEELVANYYKMSASQWRRLYDVKTLAGLHDHEIADGPFAQIIRYEARPKDAALGSASYDFYKVCIQDHSILAALDEHPEITLYPFILYIATHELIHVIRFRKFLQFFDAAIHERYDEECRVHGRTHEILTDVKVEALPQVLGFFAKWRDADGLLDDFR